jgi:HEPN domain-containing protein
MKKEFKNYQSLLLHKATVDFNASKKLLELFEQDDIELDLELIFFHMQQSVEKLLKTLLTLHKISYTKTHDIEYLIAILQKNNILLIKNIEKFNNLTNYAVEGRYAMIHDDIEDANIYITKIEKLLTFVKEQIR